MKIRLKFLAAVAVVTLVLAACSKEQKRTSTVAENFKRMENAEDERILFGMLTADEKTALASEHLDFCATYYGFSTTQLAAIASIKSKLMAVYSSNDPENSSEAAAIQLDITQYFGSLTEDQRRVTFSSMVVDEEGVQKMIGNTGTEVALTECNCNATYNYCGHSWGQHVLCDKIKCGKSSWGCGTMLIYACNGKCRTYL